MQNYVDFVDVIPIYRNIHIVIHDVFICDVRDNPSFDLHEITVHWVFTPWIWSVPRLMDDSSVKCCNTDRNIDASLPFYRFITTDAIWCSYHQLSFSANNNLACVALFCSTNVTGLISQRGSPNDTIRVTRKGKHENYVEVGQLLYVSAKRNSRWLMQRVLLIFLSI